MKKLFKNANVVDVIKKETYMADILTENGIIIQIGDLKGLPSNIRTLDLHGRTLMPGLFNCHVHITSNPDPRAQKPTSQAALTIQAINNLALHLSSGVTYVRDVGSADFIDIELREAVNDGRVQGPDMQVSGRASA